ncbi:hypothetical protein [Pelagibacterium halotolerans]|uniref:hypothetical protein n=1 Tax=Pelagibacterium halotolerans TaxID=531813 RepID=UPI00384F86E1
MTKRRSPKPRTVDRCEAYLDRLAELMAQADENWMVYQPLIERLEKESLQAREALAMRKRMLERNARLPAVQFTSPLPRRLRLVAPEHPAALTLAQLWQLAAPDNAALDAADKRFLMIVCRNSRIVQSCQNSGKSLAFVK